MYGFCSRCNRVVHGDSACYKICNKQLNTLRNAAGVKRSSEKFKKKSSNSISDEEVESYSEHTIDEKTRALVEDISSELEKTYGHELSNVEILLQLQRNINEQKAKIIDIESKNQDLINRNKNLELRIAVLERSENAVKQKALCLEIAGLPDATDDEICEALITIASKLDLDQAEIISSRKVKFGNNKPVQYLIEMQSENAKNKWIIASKKTRLTLDAVFPELSKEVAGKPVYIREPLTKPLKKLLYNAKLHLGDNFRFIWHKDGRVLARKTENSKVYNIKSLVDITRIVKKYKH
ncbi:uncharacterized protein LOC135309922 [Plodia interpunctella]|uniref:uncharacterized protein LOC135309922 n=1 Tax=Plodia interpunctella TaxID=58824 RepID=UPI003101625F